MASAGPPSGVSSVRPLRSPWPWLGLGLGVACTFIAWGMILNTEEVRFQGLKRIQADAAVERLSARMSDIAEVLRGAAGFLGHGPLPVRTEWRTYVENLRLSESYPGSHGLSFVEWIPGGDLAAHVRRVRQEGFPDYVVVPGGPLQPLPEGFSSIVYLEPMDARNQRAFGKDMLAEPRRREAMLQARDSGGITLTGKVTLYQETAHDLQAGVVLFAPVYRLGQPVETVTQRRKAFLGWASVPFRMGDLVRKTLSQELRAWDIALYDGDLRDPGSLLFDSNPEHSEAEKQGAIIQSLEVAGRTWITRVHPNPAFYADAGRRRHWEVLIGGLTATLFLFSLLITLQGAESRARRLAWQRGEDLLATESRFRALFEKAPLGMAIVDGTTGQFLSVNARLGEILGYSQTELLDRHVQSLTHPDHLQTDQASVRDLTSGARVEIQEEKRYLHRDGHEVWARLSMVGLPATPGESPKLLSILEDITERKRTEEVLERSRTDLASGEEVGCFGSWRVVFSNTGETWTGTEGLKRIYGYAPEQTLTLQTGFEAMHPEDRERCSAAWQAALKGEGPLAWEHRILVEGRVKWVSVQVRVILSEEGHPREVCGIVQDITARRRAEEAIRESEARLRILSDQLLDSFIYQYQATAHEPPRFLYLSAGVERLCGVSAEQVIRDSSLLLGQIDPTMVPDYLELEGASGATLAPFAMDLRQRVASGLWRWFRVRSVPRPQADGTVIWEGLSTDITEQMERQIALSESEARFRRVVESAADPIYLHDAEGRILLANSAACLSTGYSREELLGLRVMDIDLEFREHRDAVVWKGLKPGQQAILMGRHRRKNGTSLPVEVHVGLLREEEPRQILAMVRDLSERERAQESALRASKAESLILMAAGIAHDFNNLFQALQGNLEMAEMRARTDPTIAQPLERAKAVLHKAVSLSWKMLDFSGHFFLDMKPLDLVGWLQEACPRLQAELPEGLRMDFTWGPAPLVNADQAKLEQVLKALVDNAKEAVAGRDGHLRLRLFVDFGEEGFRPGSQGIWPLERPGSLATVCLEVADEGPGVSPDIMNLICDPFYTTHEAGRGLGLAAAVGILSAHGAGFQILNGEEKGLMLRMHFPPFAT